MYTSGRSSLFQNSGPPSISPTNQKKVLYPNYELESQMSYEPDFA